MEKETSFIKNEKKGILNLKYGHFPHNLPFHVIYSPYLNPKYDVLPKL